MASADTPARPSWKADGNGRFGSTMPLLQSGYPPAPATALGAMESRSCFKALEPGLLSLSAAHPSCRHPAIVGRETLEVLPSHRLLFEACLQFLGHSRGHWRSLDALVGVQLDRFDNQVECVHAVDLACHT